MNHIKSINFGYLSNINSDENLSYLNAMATFVDKDTLICSKDPLIIKNFVSTQEIPKDGTYQKIRAKNFVIATGTRPQYL